MAPEPSYAFPFQGNDRLSYGFMYPAYAATTAPVEKEMVQTGTNLKWKVEPDLGELDDHATLYREFD